MNAPLQIISSSKDAYFHLKPLISDDVEEVWALSLNSALGLIDTQFLFRGSVDRCLLHPRDVFRFACNRNSSSIVIVHNHPSGDPEPSAEDLMVTFELVFLGSLFQIPIRDHIIIGANAYFSFSDLGLIASLEKRARGQWNKIRKKCGFNLKSNRAGANEAQGTLIPPE